MTYFRRLNTFLWLIFWVPACTNTQSVPQMASIDQPERVAEDFVARGKRGMIASAHPLASQAGQEILVAGGNAVDAAVAVSFVIGVVRPQSTGIGGGGFALVHMAGQHDRTAEVFDFRERAPLAASRDMYLSKDKKPTTHFTYNRTTLPDPSINGHRAVAVPGLVAGLLAMHKAYGKLTWDQVLAPSIRIAEEGFPIYPGLASALQERKEVLAAFEGSHQIFFAKGDPLKLGDLLIQKDLARTLRVIAKQGPDSFYKGPIAKAILLEMRRGRGLITSSDLEQYQVKKHQPIVGTYKDHTIVSMPPPSSGGVHLIQMLNHIEQDNLNAMGWGKSATWHLIAESMRRAFADRAFFMGDPEFVTIPVDRLTSKEYARAQRSGIDPKHATPSNHLPVDKAPTGESPSTSHISVVDQEGNAVSSTQTINYLFGSGVVARGTGIVLNDEMDDFSKQPGVPNVFGLVGSDANAIAPGKTPLSSMSPTLVFNPNGQLGLIVGSPGGPRIITATFLTILGVIEFNLPVERAVHAPRIHHQWLPDQITIEPLAASPNVRSELEAMGHTLKDSAELGDIQAIGRGQDHWIGVSDVRSEGKPIGL